MKEFFYNLANLRWVFAVVFFVLTTISVGNSDYAETIGEESDLTTAYMALAFGLISMVGFISKNIKDNE